MSIDVNRLAIFLIAVVIMGGIYTPADYSRCFHASRSSDQNWSVTVLDGIALSLSDSVSGQLDPARAAAEGVRRIDVAELSVHFGGAVSRTDRPAP
jgi:hypothetical protein